MLEKEFANLIDRFELRIGSLYGDDSRIGLGNRLHGLDIMRKGNGFLVTLDMGVGGKDIALLKNKYFSGVTELEDEVSRLIEESSEGVYHVLVEFGDVGSEWYTVSAGSLEEAHLSAKQMYLEEYILDNIEVR